MTDKGVLKAGHAPTLLAAFFYFDISFMVWVILGSCLESLQVYMDPMMNSARLPADDFSFRKGSPRQGVGQRASGHS
jgi:hypothetical protein